VEPLAIQHILGAFGGQMSTNSFEVFTEAGEVNLEGLVRMLTIGVLDQWIAHIGSGKDFDDTRRAECMHYVHHYVLLPQDHIQPGNGKGQSVGCALSKFDNNIGRPV
jgi:hypothetical protein